MKFRPRALTAPGLVLFPEHIRIDTLFFFLSSQACVAFYKEMWTNIAEKKMFFSPHLLVYIATTSLLSHSKVVCLLYPSP
jgi:hypothetical protein